jgi:type IV secretion system protein VirB4
MVFLPNRNAVSEDVAELYRAYKLNDREVEIVATGETKRDYFFKTPDGSRRFELKLGRVAMSFLGSRPGLTTAASVERAKHLQALHGADWPRLWLEEAGLHTAAAAIYPTPAAAAA